MTADRYYQGHRDGVHDERERWKPFGWICRCGLFNEGEANSDAECRCGAEVCRGARKRTCYDKGE